LDPDSPGVVSGLVEELSVWEVDLGTDDLVPVPAANAEEVRYRLVLEPPSEPPNPAGYIQFYVGTRLLTELPAMQSS
jgi:hypothetical protein